MTYNFKKNLKIFRCESPLSFKCIKFDVGWPDLLDMQKIFQKNQLSRFIILREFYILDTIREIKTCTPFYENYAIAGV